MSKEYEKLLNMVNKLNSVTGEKCLICHFPDSNKNLIKLNCNHYFHSKCLEYSKSTSIIKCPYCDKKTKLVKKIEQETSIRKLNLQKSMVVKLCIQMI